MIYYTMHMCNYVYMCIYTHNTSDRVIQPFIPQYDENAKLHHRVEGTS